MIYTITFNPSIDLLIKSKNKIILNQLNRVNQEEMLVGGKGINVFRVLNTLGISSTALGYIGGFTGNYINQFLIKQGIKTDFINIKDNTRINIKILEDKITEINGPAPKLSKENCLELIKKISKLKKNDLVIISGNIPESFSIKYFEELLKSLNKNNIKFILDTSGKYLSIGLKYHPFLIKPNKDELSELFNKEIKNEKEIIKYSKELIKKGAINIITSLGKDGAIFLNKKEIYKVPALKGKVINTVGAGDSLVAGFTYEYLKSYNYNAALKLGVLLGSATSFSKDLADIKLINKLRRVNK